MAGTGPVFPWECGLADWFVGEASGADQVVVIYVQKMEAEQPQLAADMEAKFKEGQAN